MALCRATTLTIRQATTGKSKLGGFVLSKIKAFAFTASLCATILSASQAHATRVLVTYQTIVSGSDDVTSVFGGTGNSLDGLKGILEFTLDNATPDTELFIDGDRNSIFGGPGSTKFKGLPMTATLTINGITRAFATGPGATAYAAHINGYDAGSGSYDATNHFARDEHSEGNLLISNGVDVGIDAYTDMLAAPALITPIAYALAGDDEGYGAYQVGSFNVTTGVWDVLSTGQLTPYSYTITTLPDIVTSGVPEPASWAMMIAGFGLVGGAMRRRGTRRHATV
jgi:hypothetical protein